MSSFRSCFIETGSISATLDKAISGDLERLSSESTSDIELVAAEMPDFWQESHPLGWDTGLTTISASQDGEDRPSDNAGVSRSSETRLTFTGFPLGERNHKSTIPQGVTADPSEPVKRLVSIDSLDIA
jgi:hypothetical protein